MRRSRQGLTLGTTLAIVALLVVVGSGLVSATLQHRIMLDRHRNSQDALLLARSAVSSAIGRLQQDRSFGTARRPEDVVSVTLYGLPEGAVGKVSFATGPLAWSTNALEQPDSVTGYEGTAVPGHSAHLWGVGECGGVTRRVEAILTVPAFPYALAANGRIESRGGLRVAGLESLPASNTTINETLLTSASLLSNAGGAGAVKLSAQSDIRGDVRAVGGVELEPGAHVDGRVVQVEPGPLATPQLRDYDPAAAGLDFTPIEQAQDAEARFIQDCAQRRQGSLRLDQGLTLDNGLLFVEGDLTVRGGIQGKGLVVVTGQVTVEGRNQLEAGEGVALLAGGDVKLSGSGAEGSFFQGLLYTAGGLQTDSISLVGCLMAAGNQSAVELKDSRLIMPEPLREGGEWSYGGSGGGYTDESKYAIYQVMTPSGPDWMTEAELARSGATWTKANVIQKLGDDSYTQWTFNAGGGPPTSKTRTAAVTSDDLEGWLGKTPGNQAFANDVSTLTPPPPGSPPPSAPPAQPGASTRLSVKPSQFLRVEDRMRVALWLES